MKIMHPIPAGLVAALLLTVLGAGCQNSGRPVRGVPSPEGEQYLLDTEPPGAKSVADVRALLEGQPAQSEVVIVGRISGLSQPTWDPERAAFMVADESLSAAHEAAEDEHDRTPQHDAEHCPYCRDQRKKELAGLALVEVIDRDDCVPPVDARDLLGLRDGQTVVIRGEGGIDSLGALVVRTREIYVRP